MPHIGLGLRYQVSTSKNTVYNHQTPGTSSTTVQVQTRPLISVNHLITQAGNVTSPGNAIVNNFTPVQEMTVADDQSDCFTVAGAVVFITGLSNATLFSENSLYLRQ